MKLKTIAGILLVICSVAAMYMWETRWRDEIALTGVAVSSRDISAGEQIGPDCFKTISITPQSRLDGAMTAEEAASLYGKYASQDLAENQQIISSYFSEDVELSQDYSDFVIPSLWIYLKSSLLVPGETVAVYQVFSREAVGSFRLSAVPETGGSAEICCSLEDYCRILDSVAKYGENSLLIYREGDPLPILTEK